MAGQNQGGNMDQFEAYFKRADLNRDGRISGDEAVAFFQGSGLTKQVLAQIWMHADQNHAGFLGRQEFYNALKLVTVAQSKRELTPEMVKAALYGPASSKIPPPQINLPPAAVPQSPSMAGSPTMQMSAMTPAASQNLSYRGNVPSNQNMNQQYFPSPGNQLVRPSQGLPTSSAPRPIQGAAGLPNSGIFPTGLPNSGMSVPGRPSSGMSTLGLPSSSMSTPGLPSSGLSTPGVPSSGLSTPGIPSSGILTSSSPSSGTATPGLPNSSISTDWLSGRASGAPSGPTSQVPSRGTSPSTPQNMLVSSQATNKDSKATFVSGNGFSSYSIAGGDPFAAFGATTRPGASQATSSISTIPTSLDIVPVSAPPLASSTPTSSAVFPVSPATQPSSVSSSLDSSQTGFAKQPVGGWSPQAQNLSQPIPQVTSSGVSPAISARAGNSTSDQSQPPWPKMTTPGIQKYTKVFREVDTDQDGKITGEQARNLFLSWKLPREVLKQVWDLADQDSDSMLSLREFCIALYLMERYREGRSLPASLPNSIIFDENLMRMTGLPNSSHGNAAWGATSGVGFRPMHGIPASQSVAPAAGLRPVMQSAPQPDATMQFQQQKSRGSVLENSEANQLSDVEQQGLSEKNDEEKKVEKVEKVVLDFREKLEFYRSKMQELVLYKSRCDNRLNEIIERASADKREAELLGKKYEEKYKQVAEIASKLTIEEAKFREYQERKTELQQAIVNMAQGGSADGILQVRADRIQSDLEELLKALSERCKKHGIEIKSAALIELPKGWQPGIQEGAAVWDEEWDKFDDEGLLFDKEVGMDAQNAKASPKSTLFENGTYSHDDVFSHDSSSNVDANSEKQFSKGGHGLDSESGYTHSEDDSARSPHGSPTHRSTLESPSQDFSDIFAKSEADTDFHRSFDDQGWGTFDGTDDADSVWGFNSKDLGHDQHGDKLFESSGFGLSPRTNSPHGDSTYNKRSQFNFADSVPGTPAFSKSSNSPRYSEAGDGFFDNYSRFDSFNMNESSRFSPPRETLARFDSISSSRSGFGGHSRGFTSFDDADPFGSSGPFKVSSETPKKGSDNWSSF